ncbi:MAG TPA: CNNM domain-containing protein, partial [Verrucomicrobiae bacterium]|nr:CNNM domain-containing protein [Verrucomicrobiae bacterium]
MDGLLLFIWSVCLLISFFLSGMEAGVFALSRLRIRHLARRGNRRAQALYGYLESPENFFWTILVGNTLSTVVAVGVSVRWLYGWLAPRWVLLAATLAVGILVFYAACELLPKTLFRQYPNRLCLVLALPFRLVHAAVAPIVAPVAWVSKGLLHWTGGRRFTGHLFGNRDELRLVMQESGQGLSTEERSMINRVLDLQNLTVGAITVPLSRVVMAPADQSLAEILVRARETGFSRLPVWRQEGARRRVAGLVEAGTLLYAEQLELSRPAGEFLQAALYLEEEMRLERALRQMQR